MRKFDKNLTKMTKKAKNDKNDISAGAAAAAERRSASTPESQAPAGRDSELFIFACPGRPAVIRITG